MFVPVWHLRIFSLSNWSPMQLTLCFLSTDCCTNAPKSHLKVIHINICNATVHTLYKYHNGKSFHHLIDELIWNRSPIEYLNWSPINVHCLHKHHIWKVFSPTNWWIDLFYINLLVIYLKLMLIITIHSQGCIKFKNVHPELTGIKAVNVNFERKIKLILLRFSILSLFFYPF